MNGFANSVKGKNQSINFHWKCMCCEALLSVVWKGRATQVQSHI